MYSKFICNLDKEDEDIFKPYIQSRECDITEFRKMDFSGMEHLCNVTYPGMHAAASMVLLAPDGKYADGSARFKAIAIYLYTVDDNRKKIENTARVYSPNTSNKSHQRKWELAKYFALQGAVHRINMTEHGRLHFPLDSVNAITKSILPKDHPLFILLIPQFTADTTRE